MTAVLFCLNQTASSDPVQWRNAWIFVPEGYGRVFSGPMKKGDRWLNRIVFAARRQNPKGADPECCGRLWMPWEGVGPASAMYRLVKTHTCVIRPGVPAEKPCERCRTQRRYRGERFCIQCGSIIIQEGRRQR